MGKLRDEAEKLGIEVDGRWSNGTLQRKIAEVKFARGAETRRAREPEGAVHTVRLLKHHMPLNWYEVVGHYDGEENFVEGEPAPPPYPGVAVDHKLWAGTVVKLGAEDARALVENMTSLVVTDRDPQTKAALGKRQIKQKKPLAEIVTDWTRNVEAVA